MLTHEQHQDFKTTADRVARKLHDALQAGRITAITITVIRDALIEEPCWRNRTEFEALEEMTTRRVVERAA